MAKVTMDEVVGSVEDDDDAYPFVEGDDDDDSDLPAIGKGRKGGTTGSNRILAKEKQRRALEMRKAGATYDAIAASMGYASKSGARAAVVSAMGELIQEPAKELRTIQYERLNHMLVVLWAKINNGDERAIQTALSVMDKMDRLMGTDAPNRSEVDVNVQGAIIVADVNETDYIAAMQRVAAAASIHNGTLELQKANDPILVFEDDIVDADVIEVEDEPVQPAPKKKRSLSLTEE